MVKAGWRTNISKVLIPLNEKIGMIYGHTHWGRGGKGIIGLLKSE